MSPRARLGISYIFLGRPLWALVGMISAVEKSL